MQFDELGFVCRQAALDLLEKRGRPLPPTVVLPGPSSTQLVTLSELPDQDEARHAVFAQLAEDRITADAIPCWGFVAEADVAGHDAAVVVFGARRHSPHLTASAFTEDGQLEEFLPDEQLDPTAMPFLHPLQHAVDALPAAGDVFGAADPKRAGTDLPILGEQHPHD